MSEMKDKSLDDLHKQIQATRARLDQADEHMAAMGEGAQKIGMSITGATLEINALLKQLFLCAQNDLPEYEILHANLMVHLTNIVNIANDKFGRQKMPEAKTAMETH